MKRYIIAPEAGEDIKEIRAYLEEVQRGRMPVVLQRSIIIAAMDDRENALSQYGVARHT